MVNTLTKNSLYRMLCAILWFLVLVGLPLTSFPILSRLTGAIVAPFSFIPLALLMVVWMIPFLLRRETFPVEVLPYLYFVLIAIAVSALAFFLNGQYLLGRDFFGQSLRSFVTVAIGLAFYLVFSAYPRDEGTLRQTLLFIYVGGFILIGWTFFEVILLRFFERPINFPPAVLSFREALAIQSINVFFSSRVSGFAYEPSWFVRFLNLILLPIWLSAVLQRESIFKLKFSIFLLEDLLLVFGLAIFLLGSPRIGFVAFLTSVVFSGMIILKKLHKNAFAQFTKNETQNPKSINVIIKVIQIVIFILIIGGCIMGYISVASSWDERYENLLDNGILFWEFLTLKFSENSFFELSKEFSFLERIVYWRSGWRVFGDHPLGVGLGNAGFYLSADIKEFTYQSSEISSLIYQVNFLPNTKNIWVRLLSETGFLGLAVYLVWLLFLWRSARLIRKSESGVMKILGLAGQLFLLAYLVEGLSMDSFAMPYEWVMAGLISAGGWMVRRELRAKDKQTLHQEVASSAT